MFQLELSNVYYSIDKRMHFLDVYVLMGDSREWFAKIDWMIDAKTVVILVTSVESQVFKDFSFYNKIKKEDLIENIKLIANCIFKENVLKYFSDDVEYMGYKLKLEANFEFLDLEDLSCLISQQKFAKVLKTKLNKKNKNVLHDEIVCGENVYG